MASTYFSRMINPEQKKEEIIGSNINKDQIDSTEQARKEVEQIEKDKLYELLRECFGKHGTISLPPTHELVGEAYGTFQRYLLTKLPGEVGSLVDKIEIMPVHTEVLSGFIEQIKSKKSEEEDKWHEFAKNCLDSFKMFRFNPNIYLLSASRELANKEAKTTSTTGTSTGFKVKEELNNSGLKFIEYLKIIAKVAYDHCTAYNGVEKFSENWRKFIIVALELEDHFCGIAEVINKVSDDLVAKGLIENKDLPKFSIYRILAGVFFETYYEALACEIRAHFENLLKELNNYAIRYFTVKLTQKRCNEEKNQEPMKYFQDEKLSAKFYEPLKEKRLNYRILNDLVKGVSDYIAAILDMYANEKNVHYAQNICFLDSINNRDKEFLEKVAKATGKAFDEACKQIDNDEHIKKWKEEIIDVLIEQYRILFPPSFLVSTLTSRKDFLFEKEKDSINDKIERKVKDFNTLCPEDSHEYEELLDKRKKKEEDTAEKEAFEFTAIKIRKQKGYGKKYAQTIAEYILQTDEHLPKIIFNYKKRKMMYKFEDAAIVNRNKEVRGEWNSDIDLNYLMRGSQVKP